MATLSKRRLRVYAFVLAEADANQGQALVFKHIRQTLQAWLQFFTVRTPGGPEVKDKRTALIVGQAYLVSVCLRQSEIWRGICADQDR